MTDANILILNSNYEERKLFTLICSNVETVYSSSDIPNAIAFLESINFHVFVVDFNLASYSSLKGLLKKSTSIIITGIEKEKIKEIIKEWPFNRYIDYYITPISEQNNSDFLRILKKATEHSLLRIEVENLKNSIERNEAELKEAYSEIKEVKNVINESIIKELEKRIKLEAKYIGSKRERKKLEEILKNLYTANDVTNFLDIVHDIREIVHAKGISLYILEENNAMGKHLKPLVWDDAFLSHPDFPKHIVLMDSQDFAASTARYGQEINIQEINIDDLTYDARLSKRYVQQLRSPLKSILCVPIMFDKQIIGVLEVYNKTNKKKGFTDEDQQILRTLSEHIAIAITNLNLIQYDALTGLLRPNPFFEKVIQKLKHPRKRREEETSYAMVMGDVDWFKNYNDRNGHEAGNRLLQDLAKILNSSTREEDLICRYGGEEFLFFLSGVKKIEEACQIIERIRKKVEEHYFDYQEYQPKNNLTMSFGITCFTSNRINSLESITKNDLKKLANEADLAMAEAKGKNSASLAPHEKKESSPIKNKVCVYYKKQPNEQKKKGIIRHYKEKFMKERREFVRFYTSTILIYKRNSSHTVTKTINLSLGGAKISSESKLPLAQTLDLILILGSKACQLQGDIIYSEKEKGEILSCYSGLKFRDLSFENRKVLEDYFTFLRIKKTSSLAQ